VDAELAAYWWAVIRHGLEQETRGGGPLVIRAGRGAAPYLMRQQRWQEASTLLEQVLIRDDSSATVAAVLPLVRRLAEVTRGTERELIDAGMLARALLQAGCWPEAEVMLRTILDRAVERGAFRLASSIVGNLIDLLRDTGRAGQALDMADHKEDYTRRVGLGPWTQLGDEVRRLQLLARLGRHDEVLSRVEELRPQMATLPESGDQEEEVNPWNVREVILDTGRSAALRSERWEQGLALIDEITDITKARGAPALELARTRFNAYGPLLRLKRFSEARALLADCRETFATEGGLTERGAIFAAMAELEGKLDHLDRAIAHGQTALRYRYLSGDPRGCAISHFNLANDLARGGGPRKSALANRLACAVIEMQTGDGGLPATIRALAHDLSSFAPDPPPVPSSFVELCRIVEQVEGVRLAELFARLPATRAATGDEALRQVLELARSAQEPSPPPEPDPPGDPINPLPDADSGSSPEETPGQHAGND
jgi:hypothetical protein